MKCLGRVECSSINEYNICYNVVIAAESDVKGTIPSNTLFINKRETELIPFKNENKVVNISC